MKNNRWLLRNGKQRDVHTAWLVLGQGSASLWQDTGDSRLRLPCTPACPQVSAEHVPSSAQQ